MNVRRLLGLALAAWLAPQAALAALSGGAVKIGVLGDVTGPYSGMGGAGSVVAAKMAIEDCLRAECKGMKIDLVSADHQNKADIGSSTARKWFEEEGVDAIADLTNSAVALAVQQLAREKGRIALFSGPATTKLHNEECSPTGFHWMFDTYALAAGPARAVTQRGGKSWFFVTVDYAFGHSLEKDASEMVKQSGGTVVGSARHPLNSSDMASFLLQAQASKAQVVGFANGSADAVNAIKQSREFGLIEAGQQVIPLLLFVNDVHALGLGVTQGLSFVDGFYWDVDDETRAFARAFQARDAGKAMPSMTHAGVYSSVRHYLKAVARTGSDDGKAVAQAMRELPIKDPVMRNATIRADGRVIHDMYLVTVKKPAESKGAWDYYKISSVIPAADAFSPLSRSVCALVKK
ncbi:MAG: ABC transporter substrate-binding protein [Deltaproteobacteria bacterium]|nr:ABC transporter substrate-binding protein [Deltaproteobacteria bacterium]